LLAAAEKHAAIHLKAAHPWNGHALHEAFTDMSVLLLEAFEEVRVMSAPPRGESSRTVQVDRPTRPLRPTPRPEHGSHGTSGTVYPTPS
jgi:hypothetical protein